MTTTFDQAVPDSVDLDQDTPAEQPLMGREDAALLTKQIRESANKLWNLIASAYTGKVWLALEYESWDAYCEGEFPDGRPSLPRDKRREVVSSLKDAGLSVRDIAAVTDTPKSTISDDLQQVSGNRTPKQRKLRESVNNAVDDLNRVTRRIKKLAEADAHLAFEPKAAAAADKWRQIRAGQKGAGV